LTSGVIMDEARRLAREERSEFGVVVGNRNDHSLNMVLHLSIRRKCLVRARGTTCESTWMVRMHLGRGLRKFSAFETHVCSVTGKAHARLPRKIII
jgi:hypothetical protein